jgi:hypothetical protein
VRGASDAGTCGGTLVSNLAMFDEGYTIWSIWLHLPALPRLFVAILCAVSVYVLFSAVAVLVRLRSLGHPRQTADISGSQRSLAALRTRCSNMQQLLGATFLLFGLIFFTAMHSAYKTFDSHFSVGLLILDNFFTYFAFACNMFVVFLVLHLVQWFVSSRVRACAAGSSV